MRAGLLIEPGQIAVQEVQRPEPGPGEVVVRVRAALTCGTDLKAYLRGHPQIPWGSPFGHEFAGEVAATGPGVSDFAVGDAVMAVHSAPCGDCFWCGRGQGNLCPAVMQSKILGAYAEYIRVPAHIVRQNMFHKPAALPFVEAALLEPLSCVVYGLQQVPLQGADTVLIIGAGAIGLLHLLVLRARGVERVVISGRRPYRLDLARRLGAAAVFDAARPDAATGVRRLVADLSQGRGADLVIECTGRPEVWQQSVDFVRRGGHVVLFGGCPGGSQVVFDTGRLHYDQITLHSPFHFTPAAVAEAHRLLAQGRVQGGALITASFGLADVARVFQLLQTADCVKYALVV